MTHRTELEELRSVGLVSRRRSNSDDPEAETPATRVERVSSVEDELLECERVGRVSNVDSSHRTSLIHIFGKAPDEMIRARRLSFARGLHTAESACRISKAGIILPSEAQSTAPTSALAAASTAEDDT
eukprot:2490358-Prymnesium_polylepis.1